MAGRLMKSQRAGQDQRLGAADQCSSPGAASLSPQAGPQQALRQEGVRCVLLQLPARYQQVGASTQRR